MSIRPEPADFVYVLNQVLEFSDSQKQLAKDMGIAPQYLNDLLRGRRSPSDRVLAVLGLRRVIVWDSRNSNCMNLKRLADSLKQKKHP